LGSFFPIYGKLKAMFQNVPNHQPVIDIEPELNLP
jgi:hypothetical protein